MIVEVGILKTIEFYPILIDLYIHGRSILDKNLIPKSAKHLFQDVVMFESCLF
jgi:hypothetical protein